MIRTPAPAVRTLKYGGAFWFPMDLSDAVTRDYGHVRLAPASVFVAGAYATFELTYTAGRYGVDDLGGIRVVFRFACDQSPLQTADPGAPGYVTARASNGSRVQVRYDPRGHERPWFKALQVNVVRGGLAEGDVLTVTIGDRAGGGPGVRLQTFVEPAFEFRTLVDAFSTNTFVRLPSPTIAIRVGPPARFRAILPTVTRVGASFRLAVVAEDRWGNPAPVPAGVGAFTVQASRPVTGLPARFTFPPGHATHVVTPLVVPDAGPLRVVVTPPERWRTGEESAETSPAVSGPGENTSTVVTPGERGHGERAPVAWEAVESNPLVVAADPARLYFWGDPHGQSGETIGTNTARDYLAFARDKAFVDVAGHQGNDFQVTTTFWHELSALVEEFNQPGRFVVLPGYEWSGNTAVGGDRNVYFLRPDQPLHRSSHALIPVETPGERETDALTATALFEALIRDDPDAGANVAVVAHVGGRYADVTAHHDGRVEHAVEVHSAWGTFEWLLHDAFACGYRVGVVATGDDHKCRPGAAYPGASKFGSLGGLTCYLAPRLDRAAIFAAMKRRHHYATTGTRPYLALAFQFESPARLYLQDPAVFPAPAPAQSPRVVTSATMGDVVQVADETVTLVLTVETRAPIERVEIFDGFDRVATIHAGQITETGAVLGETPETVPLDRVRVTWEGAEYRARKRNTTWTGTLEVTGAGNAITRATPVNFWNVDAPLERPSPTTLAWETMTSGNVQGIDLALAAPHAGALAFRSNQVEFDLPLADITEVDRVFEAGGLGKRVRVYRLPTENTRTRLHLTRSLPVAQGRDTRPFVKLTTEDGHQAWTSPAYLFRGR